MTNQKTIVVTGATGKQGGATLRYLIKRANFRLKAMTRNPSSDAAQSLAAQGVEIVKGDLDDAQQLTDALAGAWGVFGVQNTWEAGVEKEEEQGKRLVAVARKCDVQHFVYSSVGSAHKKTGIPHFDNKSRVENALRAAGFPSYSILRPVFFMENLVSPWFLQGDKLVAAMDPATKLQMIASDDIGKFGANAFIERDLWSGAEVELAGDAVTLPEAAKVVGQILGKDVTFQAIPIEAVRESNADFAAMLEWFDSTGYSADIQSLEATWGIRPRNLAEWAQEQKA